MGNLCYCFGLMDIFYELGIFMKKKIILIELLHHHEVLPSAYQFFLKKWFDCKIVLWEYLLDKVQIEKINLICQQPYRIKRLNKWLFSLKKFFFNIKLFFNTFKEIKQNTEQIINYINKENPDYIYFNTTNNIFMFPFLNFLLKSKLQNKCIYMIHSTDLDCIQANNIIEKWYKKVMYRKLNILYINSNSLIVLGNYLYIPNFLKKKDIHCINNRVLKKNNLSKFNKITFVIPWKVDYSRRDYDYVFESLSKLLKERPEIKNKVELILLWKCDIQIMERKLKTYKIDSLVKLYDRFISEEEFEKTIMRSHFVTIPVRKNLNYGKYKISGLFGDAVSYGLPIIIPDSYAKWFDFGKGIIKYDDNLDRVFEDVLKNDYDVYLYWVDEIRSIYKQ